MDGSTLPRLLTFAWMLTMLGCANPQEQLSRAEHHYQNARYEAALTNIEDLEEHLPALSRRQRIRYHVVAGMTHLRLGHRQDARHWLALAREEAQNEPDALAEATRSSIERTITELDPLSSAPAVTPVSSGGEASGTATVTP